MTIVNTLLGQTFHETELFELLVFDIEEHYDEYKDIHVRIFFRRLEGSKIEITELLHFSTYFELYHHGRHNIEKREWLEVTQNEEHYNILLVRLDRTGTVASIQRDYTHVQRWKTGYVEEEPELPPLTPEEIRIGFQQLAGIFEDEVERQKLRLKKAA